MESRERRHKFELGDQEAKPAKQYKFCKPEEIASKPHLQPLGIDYEK